MSPRFDEVARLNNLLGRRDAIVDREKDTRTINHGIVERLAIEKDISNAAPWLIEVAGCFQDREAQLQRHIQELRSRVAVLKKIAEGERAAMLACAEGLYGIDDDHLIEARRQLAKEHPEAF